MAKSIKKKFRNLIQKYKQVDLWWIVGLIGLSLMIWGLYNLGMNLIESYG